MIYLGVRPETSVIKNMMCFPTRNKVPTRPWKDLTNRAVYDVAIAETGQVGIVPAEQGCVLIDIDVKNGVDGKKNLWQRFPNLPVSLHYKTMSGGFHLWYTVPPDIVIPQVTGKLPGIDIRHHDGYACVCDDYNVMNPTGITPCPEYLLVWLQEKPKERCTTKYTQGSRGAATQRFDLSPLPKGNRNTGLYNWGYGLMKGVNKGEIDLQDFHDLIHLRGRISGLAFNEVELILSSLLTNYAPCGTLVQSQEKGCDRE